MFSKLCRIGNEPVIRNTPAGDAVLGLSLAYSYGKKGADGKKPTQWIDATIWGKQAEAVAPYLKKGDQISVNLDELHIETYQKDGAERSKLVGKVTSFDFVSGQKTGDKPQQVAPEKESRPVQSFESFDSDIPF